MTRSRWRDSNQLSNDEFDMRRIFNIFLSFLVMTMAGCSDIEPSGSGNDSLVPVDFELPATKVMIDGLEDLKNNASVFGMFAVENSLFSNPQGDLTAADGLNLRNALCRYVAPSGSSPASLKFGYANENRVLYYPMSSEKSYSFFTYHKWMSNTFLAEEDPLQDVSQLSAAKRRMSVIMDVATVNDILYSESYAPGAVAEDGIPEYGFNAAYIRETGNVPSFTLRHPVAGVRLSVVLHPDSKTTVSKRDRFRLNSVSFTNTTESLPVQAALCIVDLDDMDNNGTFIEVLKTSKSKAWKNKDDSSGNLNVDLLEDLDADGATTCLWDPLILGGEHFIMPQDDNLVITLTFNHQRLNAAGGIAGNWPVITKTLVLDPMEHGASEPGYKAGQIYCYRLEVKYTNDTNDPFNDNVEVTVKRDLM